MNRLILVGNGFDLAHNMKTSYKDFITNYIKKSFLQAQSKGSYSDDLIEIELIHDWDQMCGKSASLSELIDIRFEKNIVDWIECHEFKFGSNLGKYPNPFKSKISPFLSNLLTECSGENWVDIENHYYTQLQGLLDYPFDKKEQLKLLNQGMKCLITKLDDYLASLPEPSYNPDYDEIFKAPINTHEFNLEYRKLEDVSYIRYGLQLGTIQVLNFNYTATLEHYIKRGFEAINYIHGNLNNDQNPIIFGFGDELDKNYERIEGEKTKGFLEYIKSFWYLRTSNYHNLIRFIESDHYQVFIMGHSCGLSDRTMMNMIFEHENCRSIKIYYHEHSPGNNNYVALTEEISRHFKDKGLFRKKVVNYKQSSKMPQVTS